MNATVRILESFLPLKLLSRLHRTSNYRPVSVEFPAAVLFVDVSRYTTVVEQMARRGKGGLENVSKLLSLSYGRCADLISDRGGEILYFEGDSLVAYWEAKDKDFVSAVGAAAACAEAICRGRDGDASNTESGAVLHAGVGAGTLWVAALGGEPVWNLVAGGDALTQAAASQVLAGPREHLLSAAAANVVTHSRLTVSNDGFRDGKEVADLWQLPPVDWLTSFLSPQLRGALNSLVTISAGHSEVLADQEDHDVDVLLSGIHEIRPISTVFARISSINSGATLDLAFLQILLASLQLILKARGGPPGEMYIDDKGLIFTGAFGARGYFHRDDPFRAIDSACAIDKTVRELGLAASIGVATGDALYCVVGSARRRQIMVLGAPLNRAARLMTAATAGVICDAPSERASRSRFSFEQQGTLQLDGLGEIAAVFRPIESRAQVAPSASLIGRDRELMTLRQTFEQARNGSAHLLAVLGEPGIGKTALVNAFAADLELTGTSVSIARAEREDRRTSFLPWRRVLASLLGLPSDCNGYVLVRAIEDRLKTSWAIVERLPLLGGVLGIPTSENDATRHLEGPHRGDATMRLLADLVSELAPRPLVLVLEDSQWLDSASWRLVEWILSARPSLLLIVCVRVEEIPEEFKNLRRRVEASRLNGSRRDSDDPARFCQILDLDELNEGAIHEVVARTLGGAPAHQELSSRVATLAGGNPFFAEEISITLKSEGLVSIRDGFWRPIKPLDDLRYFEGVERMIRERVDLLDRASFNVLKAAAVIGRSFSTAAVKTLLEGEFFTSISKDAIDSLIAVHLLKRGNGPDEFEFRHDQTRDVVYGMVPANSRQRLHGLLADWMELNQSNGANDFAALVQHFEAAGNIEKALRYADMAATNALAVGAYREVEAFLAICLSQESRQQARGSEHRLQAVRWRRQLAEAHYGRGDIHAQGAAVRRALSVAGQPVPQSMISTITCLLGRSLRLAFQQIVPPQPDAQPPEMRAWEREIARCLNQAVTVDYFELRYLRGMCNLIGSVVHAERIGPSVELAVASSQFGCGLSFLGWQSACNYFIARAERVAISLEDPAVQAHVCVLNALWRIGRCDWLMVDQLLNRSQELSAKAGDQLGWCNAQGMRFWSLYYRGDLSALEETSLALLSRAQNAGNVQQEIWALRCKALCVLNTDRPREAVDILRLITSAMLGSVDLAARISAKGALALALARIGQHAESIETATETLQLLRELRRPTSHSTLVGISGIAEVFLRGREAGLSREYDQWPSWEHQALSELKRYSRVFPLGAAQYGLWTGVAHWLDDKKSQALSAWAEAHKVAKRLSLRQDASRIAAEMRRRQKRV